MRHLLPGHLTRLTELLDGRNLGLAKAQPAICLVVPAAFVGQVIGVVDIRACRLPQAGGHFGARDLLFANHTHLGQGMQRLVGAVEVEIEGFGGE
ncbi:hypothetical protein D3C77_589100 [compost metagenome]